MFRAIFAHLQKRKTKIFTANGIVSCCCGRQDAVKISVSAPDDGQKIARNMLS